MTDATTLSQLQHRCGRCQAWFPWDGDGGPMAVAEWWLCDQCRAQLLGLTSSRGSRA